MFKKATLSASPPRWRRVILSRHPHRRHLFGVATTDAAAGHTVELATRGVYNLPKAANVALAAGDRVSWDAINGQIVAPASGMAPVGIVIPAAANGTTSARVRLDGVSTSVVA